MGLQGYKLPRGGLETYLERHLLKIYFLFKINIFYYLDMLILKIIFFKKKICYFILFQKILKKNRDNFLKQSFKLYYKQWELYGHEALYSFFMGWV